MIETGERRNRLVCFDETFRIETCPSPVDSDVRTVDPQRGIKVNHIWFWNDIFRKSELKGQKVEVRVDPWDVRYVYVLNRNRWYLCTTKLLGVLRDRTEIELRYAFEELARKYNIQKKELSPERIAEWVGLLDAQAFSPKLAEQQSQAKAVYGRLGMTQAVSLGGAEPVAERTSISTEQPRRLGRTRINRAQPFVLAAGPEPNEMIPTSEHFPPSPSTTDMEHDDDYALF
jgi:putative transposase